MTGSGLDYSSPYPPPRYSNYTVHRFSRAKNPTMNAVFPDRRIAMIFNLSDLCQTAYKMHVLKAVFNARFTNWNKYTPLYLLTCVWQTHYTCGIKQSVSRILRYNSEQFCEPCCSPRIIPFFTSRGIRWADHVARLGEKCTKGFVGNPERNRTLGTTRPTRGDVILMSSNNDGRLNGNIWLRYETWTDIFEYGLRQRYLLKSTSRAICAYCVH